MSRWSSSSGESLSVGRQQNAGCSSCALRAFFGIFFIAGVAMLYFMTFRPLWSVYSARSWDETPCTIVSSELERNRGDDGDTFKIAVTYRYEYGGQQFTGDRYHFMDMSSNTGMKWKRKVITDHPPGHRTNCYVNPKDPEQAVIHRGLSGEMWWGLFPIPFFAAGLGGLIFAPRLADRKKSTAAGHNASTGTSSTPSFVSTPTNDGPIELKPEYSPLTMFLVALFICLFWNGFTSLFVVQVVRSFLDGDGEWFMAVFMSPFVLVGLGLLAWVAYAFLSLFNPRPEMTLSRGSVPLGDLVTMTWRFRGSVRSVRNFQLLLKGQEKATYRRGTDTHTDEETFFEHVFYEADHPTHIASGEAEFEVPAESMHTFEADNNKVVWTLNVAADIPLWPDVNLSFPILVTPHEPA